MNKKKVIIWHPFPTPSGKPRENEDAPVLAKPVSIVTDKPKTQGEIDDEAVAHWNKLAEMILEVPETEAATKPVKKRKLVA